MITLNMLKRMNFLPGFGLRRSNQGSNEFPDLKERIGYSFGLGYAYTPANVAGYIREERKRCKLRVEGKPYEYPLRSYRKTRNGYFVREGEDVPYLFFPKPSVDENDRRHPGFEIFKDVALAEAIEKKIVVSPTKGEKEATPMQNDWTSLSEDNAVWLLECSLSHSKTFLFPKICIPLSKHYTTSKNARKV